MVKNTILLLVLSVGLNAAPDDIILSQAKNPGPGNIQRNLAPVANAAIGVDANKVPVALNAFTQNSATGAVTIAAQGTNQNVTIQPSGTGVVTVPAPIISTAISSSGVRPIESRSTSPRIALNTTNGAADTKIWDISSSGSANLVFRAVNDADSAATAWLTVNKTGTTINSVTFNNGSVMYPTGPVQITSTNTAGIQLYNTVDQVTNYERLEALWSGNMATIRSASSGTGSNRQLSVGTLNAAGTIGSRILIANANASDVATTSRFLFSFVGGVPALSNTSGTQSFVAITPAYNQASGTAANTDLKIERTETAVGSGAQYLIQAGTAALGDQFTVGSRGAIVSSVQALSGAGAVNVTQAHTDYVSTGGAQALTLADGTAGQTKTICHVTDGGSGVLTPTTKTGFTTITFTNAGDSVTLRYSATGGWYIVGIFGAVAA